MSDVPAREVELALAQNVLAAAIGAPELALDVAGEAPSAADLPSLQRRVDPSRRARSPRPRGALANCPAQEKTSTAVSSLTRPDIFLTGTVSGRAGGTSTFRHRTETRRRRVRADRSELGYRNRSLLADFRWLRSRSEPTPPVRSKMCVVRRSTPRNSTRARTRPVPTCKRRSPVKRLPALQQARAAAISNYAQADARFTAGLGNAVELADAEATSGERGNRARIGDLRSGAIACGARPCSLGRTVK